MLSENLRRLREDKGWSQRQLADRAGVHKAVIADVEAGKTKIPAYDRLVRIARALGVDPETLCPVDVPTTGAA